jgi:hypothetical protein
MKKTFVEGKTFFGHKCTFNLFNHVLSTNCKKQLKYLSFPKKFVAHAIL